MTDLIDDTTPRLGQHHPAAQDHQRRRPRRRAGPPVADLAAGALPRPGPQGGAARHRRDGAHRRRHLPPELRPRRAAGRLLGLRGPRLHQQAPRRRRGLRPRRHDHVAHHLRRDAPGLLRAQGPHRRHRRQLGRGQPVLPDLSPLLRPDLPRGQGPGARRGLRRAPTTTGWSRSGAATAAAGSSRCASSRCGTPTWRRPRCAATPAAACAPCASARSRPTWACPASTAGTGTPSSPPARRPGTVVCMHIGSSSKMPATSADAPVAVAATLSFGNAMASLTDFLFSGVLIRFPDLRPGLLGRADRLAALHPRAGRRRVAGAPGLGRREGHRARAAVDLLPPPGLRLLLPRPARPRLARCHRRRPHHVRDGLPAHRLDLARHPGGGRADGAAPQRRRRVPRSCAATPSTCSASTSREAGRRRQPGGGALGQAARRRPRPGPRADAGAPLRHPAARPAGRRRGQGGGAGHR